MGPLMLQLVAQAPDLVPARVWLERVGLIVPGSAATRWLLIGDIVCLVALGRVAPWPLAGVPTALGVGFVALNLAGMAVTDFYLGLALFHLAVGGITAVVLRGMRWVGVTVVVLALVLGVLT